MNPPTAGCKGIMLVSPYIVNDANLPGQIITAGAYGHVIATPDASDDDIRAFVYDPMKDEKLAEKWIIDYKNTDPAFREQLGKNMMMRLGLMN
jgi:hypothetical protein